MNHNPHKNPGTTEQIAENRQTCQNEEHANDPTLTGKYSSATHLNQSIAHTRTPGATSP